MTMKTTTKMIQFLIALTNSRYRCHPNHHRPNPSYRYRSRRYPNCRYRNCRYSTRYQTTILNLSRCHKMNRSCTIQKSRHRQCHARPR